MIIVDSSVWIDHFRSPDPQLGEIAGRQLIRMHPFVLTEIALGNPPYRAPLLRNLADLLPAPVATTDEVLDFVENDLIYGKGLGFVDIHLLASARISLGGRVWTRDKRLLAVAERLDLAMKAN